MNYNMPLKNEDISSAQPIYGIIEKDLKEFDDPKSKKMYLVFAFAKIRLKQKQMQNEKYVATK